MDTSQSPLSAELSRTLARIRLATLPKNRDGESADAVDPADAEHRGDRLLSTLNEWLLDDEQKQSLARDAGNLFYLHAAAYLCGAGLGQDIPDRWPDLGLANPHQVETLADICRSVIEDGWQETVPPPADPAGDDETGINRLLIAAAIQLARSLDLSSPPVLDRIRAFMVPGGSSDNPSVSAGFAVIAMGAHPYYPGTMQVRLRCHDPEIHRALKHYERHLHHRLQYLNGRVNPRFLYSEVLFEIEARGYTPADYRFSVDSSAALQLFTGNRLYADKRTFLRELIQNALDACQLRKMMAPDYAPEITLIFKEDISIVTIRDNGVGMDRQWLEKYFLKIGISFYQSDEIRRINSDTRIHFNFISQFGIGFLSSFLVADKIVIRTRKPGSRGLKITISNLRDYFDVRFLEDEGPSGTAVTLHLKPSRINYCRSLEYVGYLKTNIRFLTVPVKLIDENGRTTRIGMEELAYPRDARRDVDFVAALDFADSEGYLLLKAKQQTDYIQGLESAHGGIAVFQDGIFVTQLDTLLPEGARQNVVGRINLMGRERCELSMDRNRIYWTEDQLKDLKKKIRHGLVDVATQFMAVVEGQEVPAATRTLIINHLAIFFDFNTMDDEMASRLPAPIRAIIDKRFRDFIRIHYAHTGPAPALPGRDEYTQNWQQRILESFLRKAG